MDLSKEKVIEILQENPYYQSFPHEFDGKFALHYVVANIHIVIYNEVGGFINGFFVGYPNGSEQDIIAARRFLDIAVSHLRECTQTKL